MFPSTPGSMYTKATGPILPPSGINPNQLFLEQPKLNPNWYVIGQSKDFKVNQPTKVSLYGNPIAIWKGKHGDFGAISDICPHRGASISKGRIDKETQCIVCPYHTFKYNKKGRMIQTPGQKNIRTTQTFNFKTDVVHYPIVEKHGWVYLLNRPLYDLMELDFYNNKDTIWSEPEATNNNFKGVFLSKEFNSDARTVTENSLDILHISELHSFGNRAKPLPISDTLDKIADGHHKYTYQYESGENSIPSRIFGIKHLIVENEYILPHTTVARVKFGSFCNTIVTSAFPTSDTTSKLFVKAYRDNWVFNNPIFDGVFDKITQYLMEKTLNEDKSVIDTIYPEYRDGNFIVKYDNLVKLYREDYAGYVDNSIN
tara:strand:+ start:26106 stop:27218 length:1113 start_codon:yes stop_codon:yes gene_type:complete